MSYVIRKNDRYLNAQGWGLSWGSFRNAQVFPSPEEAQRMYTAALERIAQEYGHEAANGHNGADIVALAPNNA